MLIYGLSLLRWLAEEKGGPKTRFWGTWEDRAISNMGITIANVAASAFEEGGANNSILGDLGGQGHSEHSYNAIPNMGITFAYVATAAFKTGGPKFRFWGTWGCRAIPNTS
ncbi:hypothetical protein Hypma_009633 [Hypsizygus marmoreus]|uniref:Uncharacterized protein n=1 Tax=Hypsizygus marmoreus TaxID=39966 RepID=A0A369JRM6_HYPMA|nr:hypothetical protein Hypma_009633 [Hypsizygus marmoreus]